MTEQKTRESVVENFKKGEEKGREKVTENSPRELKPLDLKTYTGPLYVRNLTSGLILHDDQQGNVLTINPLSSETLPSEVAQHRSFQNLWRQGKVQVSTDPTMEEVLSIDLTPNVIGVVVEDNREKRDLIVRECLVCQTPVSRSRQEDNDTPPLCNLHEAEASNYVRTETIEGSDVKVSWSKMTMTDKLVGKN